MTVGVGIPELTHLKSAVVPALFEELLGCLAMFGGTEIRDYCRSYRQMKKKTLVIVRNENDLGLNIFRLICLMTF